MADYNRLIHFFLFNTLLSHYAGPPILCKKLQTFFQAVAVPETSTLTVKSYSSLQTSDSNSVLDISLSYIF